MVVIVIALAILGFAFPPAWLALLGYGIYIFASRKSRRNDAVEERVGKMVSAGRASATFSDLYFEAARSYAIDKGAMSPERNAASTHILVDGRNYFVVFVRATSGGTMISVEDADAVKQRIFDKPMEELRNNSKAFPTQEAGFEVGGYAFAGDATDKKVEAKVISQVARRIIELCPTELDLYRYIIEEADRLSEGSDSDGLALKKAGIKRLEYEGEMQKSHDFPDNRAALDYLNSVVSPDLAVAFNEVQAEAIRTSIFTYVVSLNQSVVNALRKKYAVHYANNCTQNGHFGFADKWDDVIKSIQHHSD